MQKSNEFGLEIKAKIECLTSEKRVMTSLNFKTFGVSFLLFLLCTFFYCLIYNLNTQEAYLAAVFVSFFSGIIAGFIPVGMSVIVASSISLISGDFDVIGMFIVMSNLFLVSGIYLIFTPIVYSVIHKKQLIIDGLLDEIKTLRRLQKLSNLEDR